MTLESLSPWRVTNTSYQFLRENKVTKPEMDLGLSFVDYLPNQSPGQTNNLILNTRGGERIVVPVFVRPFLPEDLDTAKKEYKKSLTLYNRHIPNVLRPIAVVFRGDSDYGITVWEAEASTVLLKGGIDALKSRQYGVTTSKPGVDPEHYNPDSVIDSSGAALAEMHYQAGVLHGDVSVNNVAHEVVAARLRTVFFDIGEGSTDLPESSVYQRAHLCDRSNPYMNWFRETAFGEVGELAAEMVFNGLPMSVSELQSRLVDAYVSRVPDSVKDPMTPEQIDNLCSDAYNNRLKVLENHK